jgi:predicted O-methyltransferase YrrM
MFDTDYIEKIRKRREERQLPFWVGGEHPQYAQELYDLVQKNGIKRILELGFQCGGSAYGLAAALPPDGIFVGIDNEASENACGAMEDFQYLFPNLPVRLIVGNSHEVLPTLEKPWDLIHYDHYKECYLPDLLWMLGNGFFHSETLAVFHDVDTMVPEATKTEIGKLFRKKVILSVSGGAWVMSEIRETPVAEG